MSANKKLMHTILHKREDCARCGIRHAALFADLEPDDFSLIHRPIEEQVFAPGEMIYLEGDNGRVIYTVRSGLVKLVHYSEEGATRIMRLVRGGGAMGLELLTGNNYEHEAVAMTPVALCKIPVDVIERLSQETPRLSRKLMDKWHEALQEADHFLGDLNMGEARTRILRLLEDLADTDTGRLTLPRRDDIGAIVGVRLETASRVIAALKRENILATAENGGLCFKPGKHDAVDA